MEEIPRRIDVCARLYECEEGIMLLNRRMETGCNEVQYEKMTKQKKEIEDEIIELEKIIESFYNK